MKELQIGIKGAAEVVVVHENTAAAMGSGAVEVFSTPAMVALMEKASAGAVQPYLEENYGTVGTRLEISHLAAAPLGVTVRAESELIAVEGRKLTFRVSASAGDVLIGEGTHQRFIVNGERFLAKLKDKK